MTNYYTIIHLGLNCGNDIECHEPIHYIFNTRYNLANRTHPTMCHSLTDTYRSDESTKLLYFYYQYIRNFEHYFFYIHVT